MFKILNNFKLPDNVEMQAIPIHKKKNVNIAPDDALVFRDTIRLARAMYHNQDVTDLELFIKMKELNPHYLEMSANGVAEIYNLSAVESYMALKKMSLCEVAKLCTSNNYKTNYMRAITAVTSRRYELIPIYREPVDTLFDMLDVCPDFYLSYLRSQGLSEDVIRSTIYHNFFKPSETGFLFQCGYEEPEDANKALRKCLGSEKSKKEQNELIFTAFMLMPLHLVHLAKYSPFNACYYDYMRNEEIDEVPIPIASVHASALINANEVPSDLREFARVSYERNVRRKVYSKRYNGVDNSSYRSCIESVFYAFTSELFVIADTMDTLYCQLLSTPTRYDDFINYIKSISSYEINSNEVVINFSTKHEDIKVVVNYSPNITCTQFMYYKCKNHNIILPHLLDTDTLQIMYNNFRPEYKEQIEYILEAYDANGVVVSGDIIDLDFSEYSYALGEVLVNKLNKMIKGDYVRPIPVSYKYGLDINTAMWVDSFNRFYTDC